MDTTLSTAQATYTYLLICPFSRDPFGSISFLKDKQSLKKHFLEELLWQKFDCPNPRMEVRKLNFYIERENEMGGTIEEATKEEPEVYNDLVEEMCTDDLPISDIRCMSSRLLFDVPWLPTFFMKEGESLFDEDEPDLGEVEKIARGLPEYNDFFTFIDGGLYL